jgi:hypothetical protein
MLYMRTAICLVAFVCVVGLPHQAAAQAKRGHRMQQSTIAKYTGQVETVEQQQCAACKCVELSVTLKVNGETLLVRLGPKQYFDERDFTLSKADVIEVTGLTFKEKGQTVVLATEVQKGSDTVMLRGKFGRPRWLQEHGHTCPTCGN